MATFDPNNPTDAGTAVTNSSAQQQALTNILKSPSQGGSASSTGLLGANADVPQVLSNNPAVQQLLEESIKIQTGQNHPMIPDLPLKPIDVSAPSMVPEPTNPSINTSNSRAADQAVKDHAATVSGAIDNASTVYSSPEYSYVNGVLTQNGGGTSSPPGPNPGNYTPFTDTSQGQSSQSTIDAAQQALTDLSNGNYNPNQLQQIQDAVDAAKAQYAPLISAAQTAKDQGMPKAIVQAGQNGGFENTQFAGAAALVPTKGNNFVGAGGQLEQIASAYDTDISNLQQASIAAMTKAKAAAVAAMTSGDQTQLDNAYKAYQVAQDSHNQALQLQQQKAADINTYNQTALAKQAAVAQASNEGAVLSLYQSGVTNPADIQAAVNYDANGKLIANPMSFQQISDITTALQKSQQNPGEYSVVGSPNEGLYQIHKDPKTGAVLDTKELIKPQAAAVDATKPLSSAEAKYWESQGYTVTPGTTLADLQAQGAPVKPAAVSTFIGSTIQDGIDNVTLSSKFPAAKQGQIEQTAEGYLQNGQVDQAKEYLKTAAFNAMNTTVQNQTLAYQKGLSTFDDIQSKLDAYNQKYPNSLGFLLGKESDAANAIGKMVNPDQQTLATEISSALFDYRHNQTGVAFGPQEAAAYAQLFPSIGNEYGVDVAKMNGMRDAFKIGLDGNYSAFIGDGTYYDLTNPEEAYFTKQDTGLTWDEFVQKAGSESAAKAAVQSVPGFSTVAGPSNTPAAASQPIASETPAPTQDQGMTLDLNAAAPGLTYQKSSPPGLTLQSGSL